LPQGVDEPPRVVQLVVIDDGVHRDIHLGPVLVGILAQFGNILHGVARGSPRTEARGSDVHGVGTMADGRLTAFQILGWCQ
jgi:hypothetical protein